MPPVLAVHSCTPCWQRQTNFDEKLYFTEAEVRQALGNRTFRSYIGQLSNSLVRLVPAGQASRVREITETKDKLNAFYLCLRLAEEPIDRHIYSKNSQLVDDPNPRAIALKFLPLVRDITAQIVVLCKQVEKLYSLSSLPRSTVDEALRVLDNASNTTSMLAATLSTFAAFDQIYRCCGVFKPHAYITHEFSVEDWIADSAKAPIPKDLINRLQAYFDAVSPVSLTASTTATSTFEHQSDTSSRGKSSLPTMTATTTIDSSDTVSISTSYEGAQKSLGSGLAGRQHDSRENSDDDDNFDDDDDEMNAEMLDIYVENGRMKMGAPQDWRAAEENFREALELVQTTNCSSEKWTTPIITIMLCESLIEQIEHDKALVLLQDLTDNQPESQLAQQDTSDSASVASYYAKPRLTQVQVVAISQLAGEINFFKQDYAQAEKYLLHAFKGYRKIYGKDQRIFHISAQSLVVLYEAMKRTAKSEAYRRFIPEPKTFHSNNQKSRLDSSSMLISCRMTRQGSENASVATSVEDSMRKSKEYNQALSTVEARARAAWDLSG